MSINKLAEEACMSRSTVERSLRRLKRQGWITDISRKFPTRITKTYRLNLDDRRAAQTGQYDMATRVDQFDKPHHSDAQNLKNPNSEPKGQCRSENLLKTKQRRGAPVSAGTLVSQLLNAFSSP
jgi:DNA-binding transcriptional MocR family regulator